MFNGSVQTSQNYANGSTMRNIDYPNVFNIMDYTNAGAVTEALYSFDQRLRKWIVEGSFTEVMGINKDEELVGPKLLDILQ